MNTTPRLGIGITYAPDLEPVILANQDLIQYLEIEPQMLWVRTGDPKRPFAFPREMQKHLATLPGAKLVHSVGVPVGGNLPPDPFQLGLLRDTVAAYQSPWASEHMGFNATHEFQTGFFLPQKQTAAGVQVAVDNIRRLQDALGVPVAIETGVNYLQPRAGEFSDGDFVAQIIEKADCGLLLDLHNLYTNELNGRQRILDFLQEIPLQRVWELHLAGGVELDGYWLDAHSGAMPAALYELAQQVVPRFPHLRAITFEMLSSYLDAASPQMVREQLLKMHALWAVYDEVCTSGLKINQPMSSSGAAGSSPAAPPVVTASPDTDHPLHWESMLSRLATGYEAQLADQDSTLKSDPGIDIFRKLIGEFRASMLVNTLRLTCKYLMLTFGVDTFEMILRDFWSKYPPRQFASEEAANFLAYWRSRDVFFPNLTELMAYEEAAMSTLLDGQARVVTFQADPFPLFRALTEGRLPTLDRKPGVYEIEIEPDVVLAA